MDMFQVGPDMLIECDWDHLQFEYEWFVYSYESGSYDGSGMGVGLRNDVLHVYNLGHCSCYGPCEASPEVYTVQEFFESESVLDFGGVPAPVMCKVRELLT